MAAARATRGRPHVLMHYIISMVVTGHTHTAGRWRGEDQSVLEQGHLQRGQVPPTQPRRALLR
jgi:hypothetical protein